MPQWSPLVVSGMTLANCANASSCGTPQWSPLVVSGMTLRAAQSRARGYSAAMEPARGERDDANDDVLQDTWVWPQWSPLVVSGMTTD